MDSSVKKKNWRWKFQGTWIIRTMWKVCEFFSIKLDKCNRLQLVQTTNASKTTSTLKITIYNIWKESMKLKPILLIKPLNNAIWLICNWSLRNLMIWHATIHKNRKYQETSIYSDKLHLHKQYRKWVRI
jgi:hypothetical protein